MRRTFPYGLIRVYLNVSMFGEIGIYNMNQTELYIKKSPLAGVFTGGATVARKWNTNVTIDARSNVTDPDEEPGDYTDMTWTWFCKRRCETWPTFDDDFRITNTDFDDSQCTYIDSDDRADRGCFNFDQVDGPIGESLFDR